MAGKPSRPNFLWQGLPILLPVAIMAVIAFIAIAWDRAAVEEEARHRAEEIGQQLQSSLEQQWASELNRFISLSFLSHSALYERELWPGDIAKPGSNNFPKILAAWEAAYPNLQFSNSYPNYVDFTPDGEIRHPREDIFPPKPSPVWASLSPTQREAWQKLETAQGVTSTGQLDALLQSFATTHPPAKVLLAAQVVALRNRLSGMEPTEAVQAAAAFVRSNHFAGESEAGIPLGALLMNDAIKRSREIGPTKPLWEGVNVVVRFNPSFMTPRLLDGLESIASGKIEYLRSIAAWRWEWEGQNKIRKLAVNIRNHQAIHGLMTTNFWIEQDGDQWFCATMPIWINPEPGVSNQVTAVYLYPVPLVTATLQQSLRISSVIIPDYFAATVELAGKTFAVGNGVTPSPDTNAPWFLPQTIPALMRTVHQVAEGAPQDNSLSAPAIRRPPVLLAQTFGKLTHFVQLPESVPSGNPSPPVTDLETMPGTPPFTVRILLANRDALLAQHRMRAVVLDGLVIASVFAALVGFFAARRAFLHQFGLNEMKSNFVSSVSHELRAPIASVRLMAESLERGKVNEPQKQNEYFRFIVQECRRLSSLIENVLDFSRIEQGRKQYEFEPTDVAALTRETVKLMEPYAEEKGVKLETTNIQHPTSNIELEVDGRAIQQALVNLIDNAIKHSAKGQTVTIGLDAAQGASGVPPDSGSDNNSNNGRLPVLLYVEDHGPGIPPAEHEKIFERFYRLGSELRRETQGVGIGLSIVRHIVEAHGGKITVRSNVGEGSRFTIVLPMNIKPQMNADERR